MKSSEKLIFRIAKADSNFRMLLHLPSRLYLSFDVVDVARLQDLLLPKPQNPENRKNWSKLK